MLYKHSIRHFRISQNFHFVFCTTNVSSYLIFCVFIFTTSVCEDQNSLNLIHLGTSVRLCHDLQYPCLNDIPFGCLDKSSTKDVRCETEGVSLQQSQPGLLYIGQHTTFYLESFKTEMRSGGDLKECPSLHTPQCCWDVLFNRGVH